MATYKVIQDIEAEDHILGPLSLRQFIYGLVAAFCFYLSYLVTVKHAAFLVAILLPPGLFCAFFAIPFGQDQPTEVWALAKIRFFFKPRRRIWDQTGMKDLVTITVPKKVEERRTDGLSQNEVRSRLTALAGTIDSRGWAVKNVDLNLYTQPGFMQAAHVGSDRLVDASALPQEVPAIDVNAADDIMDARNNPIAHQFDQMITASEQAHRQQISQMMQGTGTGAPGTLPAPVEATAQPQAQQNWFMQPPAAPAPAAPISTDDTSSATQTLKSAADQDKIYQHMKTIQPISAQQPEPPSVPAPPANPATRQLAANNDLNVATLSRVANKKDLPPDDEVVIALH